MAYKKGEDRGQKVFFPDCIDEYVEGDAPVRLFDAFVDSLDMTALGFVRSVPKDTGTPGYDPRDLLKLYIYGYFYGTRSSRRLARECKCNIEVMWMLARLTPDFRTISDFRKDNKEAIVKVFKAFNKFCMKTRLFSRSYISIDGSKFKAVNAKDRNFTLSKLDDRIKRLDEHITLYMEELDALDREEGRKLSKDELQHKLEVCRERKGRYEGYRDTLEGSGERQVSLTDPDARLMKSNEGFCVGYNVQTAVDAGSHLIAGFNVTNAPTDHGQLTGLSVDVKEMFGVDMLESTADKGYECPEDQADSLASGIIPNVIRRDGGLEAEISYPYKENEIPGSLRSSTRPEDLRACLEAGIIPDVYKDALTDAKVYEERTRVQSSGISILSMTREEMLAKAGEGYFVRDAGRDLVYCPQGEILRPKSEKRDGSVRYCNKLACKRCKNKCTASKFKEADFNKDTLLRKARHAGKGDQADKGGRLLKGGGGTGAIMKKVRFILHLDQNKMGNRKCLSEHPFGTLKRSLGQYFFLVKGFAKVKAEMGLFCLSYNMRRAINLLGVEKLISALG